MDSQRGNTITGEIVNNLDEPIPGVNIIVKGTMEGTITDLNGNYTISNVPNNSILIFSTLI